MKHILFVVMSIFLSTSIFANDDDGVNGPYYAFYHLQVPNPGDLIDSMNRFWSSDCGKEYPADVALSQEIFNGSYTSTHFIINTFQNTADQAKAVEIMRSCKAGIKFLQEISSDGVIPTMQYMGYALIDENDWTQDTVFAKFDINIEPESEVAFANAYLKMMNEVFKDTYVRSFGLGAVYYGRDRFTHWVWTGAKSIPELTDIVIQRGTHPAYATFVNEVKDIRTVVNSTQVQILKGWARQN